VAEAASSAVLVVVAAARWVGGEEKSDRHCSRPETNRRPPTTSVFPSWAIASTPAFTPNRGVVKPLRAELVRQRGTVARW
jgi:hypothetical protein